MKPSQFFALVIAAVVAGDVLLAMGSQSESGQPVASVGMLSMLQVGPRANGGLVGGADCDCVQTQESCAAEEDATCTQTYSDCGSPTANEACTHRKTGTDSEIRVCSGDGCISRAFVVFEECETVENCGSDDP